MACGRATAAAAEAGRRAGRGRRRARRVTARGLPGAVGPGRFEKETRVPMDVKVGDKILYGKYSGTEVTIDGEQLLILRESDVLAVIS